jgi:7,8-dihydro-6-hydroxymethylpterin-pyrophosphokinase
LRNFVLLPLFEICPHLSIPGQGLVSQLMAGIDVTTLEKIPEPIQKE